MTVKELIEELKKMPQDYVVLTKSTCLCADNRNIWGPIITYDKIVLIQ